MKYSACIALACLILFNLSSCQHKVNETKNIIHIKGSDTELEVVQGLADAYMKTADVNIEVTGEGSSVGIEALIKGQADIANSSRTITASEMITAGQNGIEPVQAIIATDAIAFITHPRLGIDSLSTVQVQQILSGEINNWKALGGPDLPIKVYGRNRKSGTYKFIESRFVKETGFVKTMIQLESNRAIINAVKEDPAGIGYVGAGFIMDESGKPSNEIWAMYLYTDGDRAFSPYEKIAVTNGDYPIIRPLYQYFNGQPENNMLDFLQFELSEAGQDIIQKFGYFPVNSYFESINKQNGISFN